MSELMVQENNLPTISDPQMWAERRQQFNQWVNTQLRENVDFGEIPGTNKATLLKPGAEKIIQVYGCSPDVEVTVRDQDPNTGYLYVEVTVRLVSIQSGAIVATGLGSCSSFESKYRYRWEWWNGRGNPPADQEYEQTRGGKWRKRVYNPDLVDVWNTVLKMAKKRALVDAALTISGASEKFTQDVEDFDEGLAEAQAKVQRTRAPAPTERSEAPRPENNSQAPPSERPWRPEQVRAIVTESAASRVANGKATDGPAQSQLQGAVAARISELFPNDASEIVDMKRRTLLYGIFDKKSTKELTDAECRALLAWASEKLDDGQWVTSENASVEAQMIVEAVEAEAGQQKLM